MLNYGRFVPYSAQNAVVELHKIAFIITRWRHKTETGAGCKKPHSTFYIAYFVKLTCTHV
jgi:hypothetical protein